MGEGGGAGSGSSARQGRNQRPALVDVRASGVCLLLTVLPILLEVVGRDGWPSRLSGIRCSASVTEILSPVWLVSWSATLVLEHARPTVLEPSLRPRCDAELSTVTASTDDSEEVSGVFVINVSVGLDNAQCAPGNPQTL